jgi:CNT family concentrative nucleoside transporter
MGRYNLVSLGGLFLLVGFAWLLSADRRRMNFRAIGWGVAIQLALGMLVFWAPPSREVFEWLNDAVLALLGAAQKGQGFLFGPLADAGKTGGFVLAIQALPVIIFFAAVMGLLYHWRIMPAIIRGFAYVFTRLMRISGAESLCVASNIFVGIESATTVRPFLARMTRSEFCTILTAGMATVASSTLAVYVGFLKDTFEGIAGHLISASILSAPAAIVFSKVLLPEDGRPVTLAVAVRPEIERHSGAMEAVIAGAMAGVKLVVGICALLIAFLGIVALIDLALGAVGGWMAEDLGCLWARDLSLTWLLGWVFRPVAWVIGVPWSDAGLAGQMLGKRMVVTEIPAYSELAAAMEAGAFQHPRSPVVIAYALCGFAHVASLAIFVGGVAALVPERRRDLAAVGPRALLAATLACLMTGAVAGTFFLHP